jgi:hypothetical protein
MKEGFRHQPLNFGTFVRWPKCRKFHTFMHVSLSSIDAAPRVTTGKPAVHVRSSIRKRVAVSQI